MSKSLGNLVTIEEFLDEHPADVLRMMVLNSGYRSPLTFNDEVIEQTENALDRIHSALKPAMPDAEGLPDKEMEQLREQIEIDRNGFESSMDDDFNTAGALGHVFSLVRAINQARMDGADDVQLSEAQKALRELSAVFGLTLSYKEKEHDGDPFVDLLVEIRMEIRKQKMWELSDFIRDRLADLGVQVEDTKSGSSWSWK